MFATSTRMLVGLAHSKHLRLLESNAQTIKKTFTCERGKAIFDKSVLVGSYKAAITRLGVEPGLTRK